MSTESQSERNHREYSAELRSIAGAAPDGGGSDPLIGKDLGRYRVLRLLGRGGKGVVYEALDVGMDRHCALKVMSPDLMDAESKERFLREARASAAVDHPNAVTVFTADEQDGTVFLAMSLMPRGSVQDRLGRNGRFRPAEATRIAGLAARGLGAVHRAGFVHRDIKPANILLGDAGEVRIADYGLAKALDCSLSRLTTIGAIAGSPHYMSPEQCLGDPVDARSDVYSLGVAYYRMLTGRVPFRDATSLAIMRRQISEPVPDPRLLHPSIPPECAAIVARATAKPPSERYGSADEMADELKRTEGRLRCADSAAAGAIAAASAPSQSQNDRLTEEAAGPGLGSVVAETAPSGSGLFDVSELMRRSARAAVAGQPRADASRSGSGRIAFPGSTARIPLAGERNLGAARATNAAERDFDRTVRADTSRSNPDMDLVFPVSADYTFEFADAAVAKAGLRFVRADVRSMLHKKTVWPATRCGSAFVLLRFTARLPPNEHLGLVKSLTCAGGRCASLHAGDRDIEAWLRRRVTLLRTP